MVENEKNMDAVAEIKAKVAGMGFEDAMKRLQEVLRELEEQTAPLDAMLGLYEEGAALVERCNRILDDASNRVSRIGERDGSFTEEPFGDGDE